MIKQLTVLQRIQVSSPGVLKGKQDCVPTQCITEAPEDTEANGSSNGEMLMRDTPQGVGRVGGHTRGWEPRGWQTSHGAEDTKGRRAVTGVRVPAPCQLHPES